MFDFNMGLKVNRTTDVQLKDFKQDALQKNKMKVAATNRLNLITSMLFSKF